MAKNKKYEEMYARYKEGFSLQEVGRMYGCTRQAVYEGFRCRGFRLREKKKLPFLSFNGEKYTLRNTGYYGRTYGDRELMHRAVWKFYKGQIPENHDIHHKNHDKTDNRVENLELYEKSEHARKFNARRNQYSR